MFEKESKSKVMIDEIKKSINSIFNERVSSPFYGTLIVSWLIWNWKIIYLTFFVKEDNICGTKIDFITANYNDPWHLVYFPLISTLTLLTLIPFITNGAYWLDLKFTTWRVNQKNRIEGKRLLTIEQSIKLRSELRELEENFEKLLEKKNDEIKILQSEISEFRNSNVSEEKAKVNNSISKGNGFVMRDYNLLVEKKLLEDFIEAYRTIKKSREFPKGFKNETKEFFLVNHYYSENVGGYNDVNYKGEETYRTYVNNNFEKQ